MRRELIPGVAEETAEKRRCHGTIERAAMDGNPTKQQKKKKKEYKNGNKELMRVDVFLVF